VSRRTVRRALLALGLLAAAIWVPFFLPPYWLDILVLGLVAGIAAMGLDVLMGYTGLDSLGQAAFFGTAAYGMGILTVKSGVSWFVAAGLSLAIATALAVAVGAVSVRLKGLYFLLITLAFGQVLWGGVLRWGEFTGGYNGLSGVPKPIESLTEPLNFAYLVVVIFAIVVAGMRLLVSSPFGLGLQGIRDDELRLRTLGFRSYNLKWVAFAIAGLLAALAGVLNATYQAFVSPSDLNLQLSFALMLMVIVGGAGRIYGAVIGAAVVTVLQYELSLYIEEWWVIVLGAVYIVTTLLLPDGILGALTRLRGLWRRRGEGGEEADPAGAAPAPAAVPAGLRLAPTRAADAGGGQVLGLSDVSVAFGGFRALDGVSLRFQQGERTAIIGPNGAGKTTLFNVVSGLQPATTGSVDVLGTDVTRRGPHTRPALGLSRTFQVTRVFQPLTVRDNMILGLLGWTARRHQYRMWRRTPKIGELRDRARQELDRMGLDGYRDVEVRHLSYGHQKQLDIALALAAEPKVLLLDEPTAGLSQGEASRMMSVVEALPADITVLIIEHNLDVVFGLTERLIVLDHGQVLIDGGQEEVRQSEDVRRIYFGAAV
jgi:branched-chain amino acid transport system ATP-binding protein/branched-chain amino acid transport system permease protein